MIRFIIEAPRWVLLFLLAFAPWAYGCTRPGPINFLIQVMPLVILLWIIGCIIQRRWPVVHPVLWITSASVFLQGWGMIANAQTVFDHAASQFHPLPQLWKGGPGVVDQAEAIPIMLRITGLLGIACFAADLCQRERWRRRVSWTIGLTGGSLILFGIVQRMLGAPGIFWDDTFPAESFFATYFYHANAAAYINLVLPIIAGLAYGAFRTRDANLQRAWLLPTLIIAFAGSIATASKAGVFITVLLAIAFIASTARSLFGAWRRLPSAAFRSMAIVAVTVGIFAAGWFGWERMTHRLSDKKTVSESSEQRLLAYQTCVKMIPDAGAWGFGAGTFSLVFPFYTNDLGNRIEGFWQFAHDDYLQTLLEWGWTGLAVGSVLFLGGLVAGILSYRRRKQLYSSPDRTLLVTTVFALSGVALHAAVDFPLQIASLQLYVAVYLGILWGSGRWRPSRPPDSGGSR